MLINEIAAPGSLAAQAGVYGRSVARALGQRLMPDAATDQALTPRSGAAPDTQLTAPIMQQLIQAQQQLWVQNLAELMRSTRNLSTNTAGVVSVSDVPRADLERAIMSQVSDTLRSLSQGRVSDVRKLPDIVPPAAKSQARNLVTDIKRNLGALLRVEPNKPNETRMKTLWASVLGNIDKALQMTQFQTTNVGGTDRLTLPGGQVLDPNNPNDARVIAALRAQGAIR